MAMRIAGCRIVGAGSGVSAAWQFHAAPTPDPIVLISLAELNGEFEGVEYSYFASQEAKNQILAVALAAISTQSTVTAYIDDPPGAAGDNLQCYALLIGT
jgi:hypothetical protein